MNLQHISVETRAGVALVSIERPKVHNAFDSQTIVELTAAFRTVGSDATLRAIVLGSRGERFCAGADLNWMRKMAGFSDEENRADAVALATMLNEIHRCPLPVIARVQGDAFGGGVGLVAAADIAIGASTAHFALSEPRLGLIPSVISPYVLRAIGARAAHRYFVTAESFDAARAHQIGLLHEVVESEALDSAVETIIARIRGNGPRAVIEAKRLALDFAQTPIDDALIVETASRIAQVRASDEAREGVDAFLAKRPPAWR